MSNEAREYPKREIFLKNGGYARCQIMNWHEGSPPKYLACNQLERTDAPRQFLAKQAMGTWCEVDVHEAAQAANAIAALPVQMDAEPVAWLVNWSDSNGNSCGGAYTNEADALRAAKNIEAYFTVKATATVTPLFASPPAPASQVLTEEERDFVKPIRGTIERARGSGYWAAGEKTIARLVAIIDRITNKDAEHG